MVIYRPVVDFTPLLPNIWRSPGCDYLLLFDMYTTSQEPLRSWTTSISLIDIWQRVLSPKSYAICSSTCRKTGSWYSITDNPGSPSLAPCIYDNSHSLNFGAHVTIVEICHCKSVISGSGHNEQSYSSAASITMKPMFISKDSQLRSTFCVIQSNLKIPWW